MKKKNVLTGSYEQYDRVPLRILLEMNRWNKGVLMEREYRESTDDMPEIIKDVLRERFSISGIMRRVFKIRTA